MESVLKEIYRSQSYCNAKPFVKSQSTPNVLGVKSVFSDGFSHESSTKIQSDSFQRRLSELLDKRVRLFAQKLSEVPGFEELYGKRSTTEIIFWSWLLFLLVGLTGYSFVQLICDYINNPTITNVNMVYSHHAILPAATLCLPLHLDILPSAQEDESTFFSWKDANEYLEKLLTENDSEFADSFKCKKHLETDTKGIKRNVKARLINEKGEQNKDYGRVEIFYNNKWGTICDSFWDPKNAMVVCRMVNGFPRNATTLHSIQGGEIPDWIWMENVECSGQESNLGECPHTHWGTAKCSSLDFAAVDCTGLANPEPWSGVMKTKRRKTLTQPDNSTVENLSQNYSSSLWLEKTAAALLARLTALETNRTVKGETPAAYKWSTSTAYPGGLIHKERAIENLLELMTRNSIDLHELRRILSCRLCDELGLEVLLQEGTKNHPQKVLDCSRAEIMWIENSAASGKVCFAVPLAKNDTRIKKGTFKFSLDIGSLYKGVDWSDELIREIYSNDFELDLSGSVNADKDKENIRLSPGDAITVTLDVSAKYVADDDCSNDFSDCELKCAAKELLERCKEKCVPISLDRFHPKDQENATYCMIEDYRNCLLPLPIEGVVSSTLQCTTECKQPCNLITHAVRTLHKKKITDSDSNTRLFVQVDSEVYPEFTEQSVITWYGLMGDLGGVIGLWLGASFVGVVHFIQFILRDLIWARKFKKFQRVSMKLRGASMIHSSPGV